MLKKLEGYRKFIVALIGAAGGCYAVIETADFSTKEGVVTCLVGLAAALGVYAVPNKA